MFDMSKPVEDPLKNKIAIAWMGAAGYGPLDGYVFPEDDGYRCEHCEALPDDFFDEEEDDATT